MATSQFNGELGNDGIAYDPALGPSPIWQAGEVADHDNQLVLVSDFEELFTRYGTSVGGYIYNQTRDLELAKEGTQEVFLRALRWVHHYNRRPGYHLTHAGFGPLSLRIARNVLRDAWRRDQLITWQHLPERGDIEDEDSTVTPFSGPSDETLDPERIIDQEHSPALLRALMALPPERRLLIWRHDVDGFTAAEVTTTERERINLNERLYKIRLTLRRLLAQQGYFDAASVANGTPGTPATPKPSRGRPRRPRSQ